MQRPKVKRCAKCLMPNSLPRSQFDENGVCRWCRTGFPNYVSAGEEALVEFLAQERSSSDQADCLVAVSGGKDSTYVLLQLQKKFGQRVEAFTYVHDGLSDFALDNAKRSARILGVKHHLVSLPRHVHHETFKKFFRVWVKSQDPLAAAMMCVACKNLHYLGLRLAKKRGIKTVVWSVCPLETPPFIPTRSPQSETRRNAPSKGILSLMGTLAGSMFSDKSFMATFLQHCPTCIRGCLAFDPEGSFLKKRFSSVRSIQFFNYHEWKGETIKQTITEELGWCLPNTIKIDWHSDCLFNVFKEYTFQKMYYTSYTDAFLSNQIRHGYISRQEAYKKLLHSKQYYAGRIQEALKRVGLEDLLGSIDFTCFDVDDGE